MYDNGVIVSVLKVTHVIGECIKIALLIFGDVQMKLKLQIVMM